jgi:hypothetical protein
MLRIHGFKTQIKAYTESKLSLANATQQDNKSSLYAC